MIDALAHAGARPEPYAASDGPFWDDPYIAARLLEAHLDQGTDAASRRDDEIARTVDHLVRLGLAGPGRRVLDLGCGPGLYAQRLARVGCEVTGVDLSRSSVAYAREQARRHGLAIEYRVQDFTTLDEPATYDLVLQVYGELSTFSDEVRDDLLLRARRSLRPGGAVVLDVSTPVAHPPSARSWEVVEGGLWRPGRHLVLTEQHRYPGDLTCSHYVVVAGPEDVTAYRMWFHDYTPQTLAPALTAAGLRVEQLWGSLAGDDLTADSPWLAVLARAA
ncbi:SAM-dependent methyltransferase [Cellulomonas soli]|uniref:SAM-dependent methyltransferase n=1 Tax=Cellulomonas soli TaxID=931535 RepID=UPI003F86F1F7